MPFLVAWIVVNLIMVVWPKTIGPINFLIVHFALAPLFGVGLGTITWGIAINFVDRLFTLGWAGIWVGAFVVFFQVIGFFFCTKQ